ncbi:hypothetical protein FZC35_00705 [Candidatus Cytomitobacter indipagum]|uniref:TGS domain-containing protein n=1 Tax=Candidatus Cytomitobacter indipagum TaxID=2601575 RepID=A0A5C0UD03_9PROT|nr:hypothetical protein [Candidatus Cytomitobacter indipagum]QEK37906.1 hypothetical protein FZC35_00705 [Candidatus Cytomitobacter indipagum]
MNKKIHKIHIDNSIKGINLIKESNLDSKIIGFKSDESVYDLHTEIPAGSDVTPLYREDHEYIHFLRHDAAHVLAQALTYMYPAIKFGKQFFRDENVFGFDVHLAGYVFTASDFSKIAEIMRKVVASKDNIIKHIWDKEKALSYFSNDKFKQDIISNSPKEKVTLYEHGDYIDICGGPRGLNNDHVGEHFALLEIESSTWMYDDEKNMQRIIGICFRNKDEMDAFMKENNSK